MEHPSTTKRIRLIQVRISFCQVNGDKCVGSFFALLFWHILTLASYVSNESYDSGDSVLYVKPLWPGLAKI